MARPWRIQFPGAIYHVTSRGNNQREIFLSDADRRDFLKLLAQAVPRFNLEIFAYCLMGNHYHLFLRTPEGNLSAAFHWLNATYTIRFQRRHRESGHFLQGRFKAVLVLDDAHYQHLSMYLHLNPVRAGMVADPAEYQWSSFPDYTSTERRDEWLNPDEIISCYGKGAARFKRYRDECLALIGKKPAFVEQLKKGTVIGPKSLVEKMVKKYRPQGEINMVPAYRELARPEIDVKKELARVARTFAVEPGQLLASRRSFVARQAAYWHLTERCGLSATAVAKTMKVGPSAVSMGIRKFRELVAKDRKLEKRTEKLIDD